MNKLIKQELDKVAIARLPNYTSSDNIIKIPQLKQIRVEEGKYYLIELHDSILNPNELSTLAANWNQGSVPQFKYMKVDTLKVFGKMIRVMGLGYNNATGEDLSSVWTGWLPLTEIEVLKEL